MTRRPLGSSIATWLLTGVLLGAAAPAESIDLRFSGAQVNGTGDVAGLNGAYGVTVSPDGKQVYLAGELDNALAVFSRDPATGALTFVEVERDAVGGVAGLKGAHAVVVSPDGAHVYVASSVDDAVAVVSRDATTGKLTFVEAQREGANGVTGLAGARAVTVSPDGANLYVAGATDDALAVFSRDAATGRLTFVEAQH